MRGPISCLNAILDRWPALAAKFSAATLLAAKNILLHHGPVKFARTLHRGCDAQKAMGLKSSPDSATSTRLSL